MLLLLRGLPASGKSTFVKNNNLEDYTISFDELRKSFGSNELEVNGNFRTATSIGLNAIKSMYIILEERMKLGAFTILDATHLKNGEMQGAYKLAKQYRYRVYCVDFTDVPYEVCLERDSKRAPEEQVGEFVMHKMYDRLKSSSVPSGIKVIKPEDWYKETKYRTEDLSMYKKIHHIGDIHGCYTALKTYLKDGIKSDEFYIFLGDFIDRGIENVEVMKYIYSIYDKPNVVLLEGNHERYLRYYFTDEKSGTNEFDYVTAKQFDSYNKSEMQTICRRVYNKLRQCIIYKYNNKVVLCTHGGLSRFVDNLSLINTNQMIYGVGKYRDMLEVSKSFENQNKGREIYQIYGHRNVEQVPIEVNSCCFNLCEHIEFGGSLRALELDKTGFHSIYVKNPVFKQAKEKKLDNVRDMLSALWDNENIKIVPQGNTNIASYNFTRKAFQKSLWDATTIKARGLFINSKTQEIVARGYDKFFNADERPETNLDVLINTVSYPLTAYKKENGFLGLLGYDKESDKLLYCSKSEMNGTYSNYFKNILLSKVPEKKLYEFMKDKKVTMLFEVVDIENDPHIISYRESKVILLDIVKNSVNFERMGYENLQKVAEYFKVPCKEKCFKIRNAEEFSNIFSQISEKDFKWKNRYIEGFVFEDSLNYMFKYKTPYYRYWKYMRTQLEKIENGQKPTEDNEFTKWLREQHNLQNADIISLRRKYLQTHRS